MGYITIPAGITTAEDKNAFALRFVELLRIEHNKKGAAVDTKNAAQVTAFRNWQTYVFDLVNQDALFLVNEAKQMLYNSARFDGQIDAAGALSAREADI